MICRHKFYYFMSQIYYYGQSKFSFTALNTDSISATSEVYVLAMQRHKEYRTTMSGKIYKCSNASTAACNLVGWRPTCNVIQGSAGTAVQVYMVCDYAATTQGNLQKHLRIHANLRPYVCDYCDYSSTESSALCTHMRMHSGKSRFSVNDAIMPRVQ